MQFGPVPKSPPPGVRLFAMAVVAGITLTARISTGIALSASFGLFALAQATVDLRSSLAGLGVGTMLMASAASYRYRCDVLPPMEFAALLGTRILAMQLDIARRRLFLIAALALLSVIMSHLFAALHITATYGSSEVVIDAPTMLHEMYWRLASRATKLW